MTTSIHRALLDAARVAAPFGAVRRAKPWCSGACGDAYCTTLRAFRRRCDGVPDGVAEYIAARREADQVYRREKCDTWRAYAATLSTRTSSSRVWKTLRTMDGRSRQPLPDTPIVVGGKCFQDDAAKAKAAAAHYTAVSRLRVVLAKTKAAYMTVREHVTDSGDAALTAPFTLGELSFALRASRGKSPGPDGVHPEMLRHLPPPPPVGLYALRGRRVASLLGTGARSTPRVGQ